MITVYGSYGNYVNYERNVAKLSLNSSNSGNLPEESRGVVSRVTWLNLATLNYESYISPALKGLKKITPMLPITHILSPSPFPTVAIPFNSVRFCHILFPKKRCNKI